MRKKVIFFLLLLPTLGFGQPLLKELPHYSFINYRKNILQYPGNRNNLDIFYKKLDSLLLFSSRDISIVHIGGSHVQADVFSNRMRMNLAEMTPGVSTERGLIFPYRIAKTNNPRNYAIQYKGDWEKNQNSRYKEGIDLGISGIAVRTKDPDASISIRLNRNHASNWEFDQFRLIGYSENDSVYPVAVIHGDSIKARYEASTNSYVFHSTPSDSITICFKQRGSQPSTFTVSAMLPENHKRGLVYHSLGVNGASVPAWLRCSNFEKELKNLHPDLVIMAIGINDANVPYGRFNSANFKHHYNELIESIERVSPNCAILFITNNDAFFRAGRRNLIPNKNGTLVQQAFKELAAEHNAAVWDLYSIMGGLGSMRTWQNNGLANSDKIHFTQPGYVLLGDMLYNALISDYLYRH